MTSMAHLTAGRTGALQHWSMRALAVTVSLSLILTLAPTARGAAAQVTDLNIKASKAASSHAQDALADAQDSQAELASTVKKAEAKEAEVKADLAAVEKQFAVAPEAKKAKLSAKIRELQEEANHAGNIRALNQSKLARADARLKARKDAAERAATACAALIARQQTQKAERAQSQAAPQAIAPVVAAPVVATPKVAAPVVAAPKVAAPKVATPVVAAPVVAAPQAIAPVVAAPVVAAPQATAPVVAAPVVAAPVVAAPQAIAPVVAAPVVAASQAIAPVVAAPDMKSAKAASTHAQDALAAAEKSHTKQVSALKKATAEEAEAKADLTALQSQFATAPPNKKEKLSAKIRAQQEDVNKAANQRALLQADVARAQAQVQARQTEAAAAAAVSAQCQAQEKAKAAAPVVAAQPKPAAPVVAAQPKPVAAAAAVAAQPKPAAPAAPAKPQDLQSAKTASARAADALDDAKETHAKQLSALKKTEAEEAEIKAELTTLQNQFVAAPQGKKEKLSAKIRSLQEEATKASQQRTVRTAAVAQAETQVQARTTEAAAAAAVYADFTARQQAEKAAQAQRQAQEKAKLTAAQAKPAAPAKVVAAEPKAVVPTAPVTAAQPKPVVAASVVAAPEAPSAKAASRHADEALAAAQKAQAKQQSAVKDAEEDEAELKADLAALQKQLAAAPQNKKEKLSAKIRSLQEDVNKAANRRALLQADLARAQAQVQARKTEAAAAAAASAEFAARQQAEKAEHAQRLAQDKAKATKVAAAPALVVTAPAPAAAPVVATAAVVAAAPAPVVAAAPAPASVAAIAQAEASLKQALDQKTQADAVVAQRTQDLANSKDAEARKKAQAALQQAEKYAAGKDKDYKAALVSLDKAKQPPPPVAAHVNRVSEPTAWAPPAALEPAPILRADQALAIPEPKIEEIAPPGTKLMFDATMLAGDKDIVQDFPVWKEWADYVIFNPVTADEINAFHAKFTKALQEKGYVFAKVTFPTRIWAYGIFLAKVDLGPLGTITVKGNRFYSSKQITDTLANQPGARFNYARVHGDIFDLNAKPDLNIDAKLKPSIQNGRRVIDAELNVEDSLPIHGAIELSNTGTKYTNDWRIRSTLQEVNLTQNDDVLTAEWLTSPDLGDVNAYTLGYNLPIDKRWSFMANAGYSNSDIQGALEQIDVLGRGYFAQIGVTKVLHETPIYRDMLTLSWLYQNSETQLDVSDDSGSTPPIRLSMPSLAYDYQSRVFDPFYGRSFLTVTGMANFAGKYGSSEDADFLGGSTSQGAIDGDFSLLRVRLARLQRFTKANTELGKWTLFMKVDTQVTGDSLPSAVRRSVGGANSVRGYTEGEISGDNAVYGTLELRAPLFENFIPGFKVSEKELEDNPEFALQHRLQLLAFTDAAYVKNNDPQASAFDNETLSSVGAGFRFGFTKYSQMRLDYGIPLMDTYTADTPKHGRLHASLQLQF